MFWHLSLSQVSYIRQSLVRWSVKRAKYGFVFQIFVHGFDFSTLLTWMKQLNKVHFDNLPFSNNFGPFSPFQSFEVLHWLSTLWDHLRVTVASDKLYLLGKEYFWTEILPFSHQWETSKWENSTFFTGICNITNCNHNVWMEHQIPKNRRWSNTIYLLFLLSSNITITPRPPCFPNNPENECTAPPRERNGMILVHVAAAVKIRQVDTNPSGAANYSQISLYMANSSRQKTNITKMNQIKTFWSPWQSSLVNISLGGSVTALLAKLGPVQFGSSGISDAGGLARTQTSAQGEL